MNKWYHIAASWNKTERYATIVVNGQHDEKKQGVPGPSPSIRISSRAQYELGIKGATYLKSYIAGRTLNGYMKHLMVFDRVLNKEEIQAAMGEF
jgi:hypothetical protein